MTNNSPFATRLYFLSNNEYVSMIIGSMILLASLILVSKIFGSEDIKSNISATCPIEIFDIILPKQYIVSSNLKQNISPGFTNRSIVLGFLSQLQNLKLLMDIPVSFSVIRSVKNFGPWVCSCCIKGIDFISSVSG